MSAPVYFIQGASQSRDCPQGNPSRDLLASVGLSHTLADVKAGEWSCFDMTAKGPDGQVGMILAAQTVGGEVPRLLGYYPDRQQWRKCGERLWLGFDPEDLPTPDELKRRQQVAGYDLELGDGQTWTVPVVRRIGGGTNLPASLGWNEKGEWASEILPAYRSLWDEFGLVASGFFRPASAQECRYYGAARDEFGNREWSLPEVIDLAARLLAVNYRVDRYLTSALGLFQSTNWESVLFSAIDGPAVRDVLAEMQKKSASSAAHVNGNAQPGPADSCPTSPPVTESCS